MRMVDIMTLQEGLLSTNLPSDGHPTYSAQTTYSSGDVVLVPTLNMLYQSIVDNNQGVWPEDGRLNIPPEWRRLRPANTWAMFDGKLGTQSESSETTSQGYRGIEVDITVSTTCDALALFGVSAESAKVVIKDSGGNTVYSREIDTVSSDDVYDWYTYFTAPIVRRSNIVLTDLNAMPGDTVSIYLRGDPAVCANTLIGKLNEFGVTNYGSSVGITDYSTKEFDDFGSPIVVERGFSKKGNFDVEVPAQYLDSMLGVIQEYRATATLWIGSELHSATMIYGFYWDFEIVLESYGTYELSIEIEGLTE